MITGVEFRDIVLRVLDEVGEAAKLRTDGPYSWEVGRDKMTVLMMYDQSRSRELTVGLRQQGQSDPPFGISDVLRVTACPEQEYERLCLCKPQTRRCLKGSFSLPGNC